MDPKAIYNASKILQHKINWAKPDGREWIHVDTSDDFRDKEVLKAILAAFDVCEIYVVVDRRNVFQVRSQDALPLLCEHLKHGDVTLWDKSLKKTMFFSSIGVFRYGQVAA